jgi:hypothetical protein
VRLVGGARPGKSEEPIDHRRTQHSPQQHREAREAAAVCVSVCVQPIMDLGGRWLREGGRPLQGIPIVQMRHPKLTMRDSEGAGQGRAHGCLCACFQFCVTLKLL